MEQASNQVVNSSASVLNATTLLASPSHPNKIEAKKIAVIGKIPVVISEADVQVYVDATIRLEEPALEITRVKKNVHLNRCELLLTDDKKSAKLLISGFVRKNIEYSTVKTVGNVSITGDIHCTVVNIPFKCFAKVDFVTEPITAHNAPMYTSSSLADDGMGSDECGINITNSEILNEKIYCELIQSKIRESSYKHDLMHLDCHGRVYNENTFRTFQDSMVVELKLRVLQNQNVQIVPAWSSGAGSDNGGKGGDGNSKNNGSNDKSGGNDGKEGGKEGGNGNAAKNEGGTEGNSKGRNSAESKDDGNKSKEKDDDKKESGKKESGKKESENKESGTKESDEKEKGKGKEENTGKGAEEAKSENDAKSEKKD